MREVGIIERVERRTTSEALDERVRIVRIRSGDSFAFSLIAMNCPELFCPGEVVTFELDCDREGKNVYVVRVRHISAESERHTLAHALLLGEPNIGIKAVIQMAKLYTSPDQISNLIRAIDGLRQLPGLWDEELQDWNEPVDILQVLFSSWDKRLWFPAMKVLLSRVKHEEAGVLLSAKAERLSTSESQNESRDFWSVTQSYAIYGTKLYNFAPNSIKKKMLSQRFDHLLAAISDCIIDSGSQISWSTFSVYSAFTEEDQRLAEEWLKKEVDTKEQRKFALARMISARCAEKVAIGFYGQFGHRVRVCSKRGVFAYNDV